MEKRKLNMSFSKSGSGSIQAKLSVPKSWLDKLGINQDQREVDLIFDEEKQEMVLKKHKQ